MRAIRPIDTLGHRVQEAGKLRMGVKTGNAMKAIDTWRFTSPHHDCIEQLAALYGGTPKPWSDAKAATSDQLELISEAATIDVVVPPDGLSQYYELWAGRGCVRRCTGVTCQVPTGDGEWAEQDCICTLEDEMQCKPHTRLTVALPDITFRGVWTLATKSWNAAEEMPAMEAMIDQLQSTRAIIRAQLTIEGRSRMTQRGKRNFVVPVLSIPHTMNELTGGEANLALDGPRDTSRGTQVAIGPGVDPDVLADAEVVEADVVPEVTELLTQTRTLANQLILDPAKFLTGLVLGATDGDSADPQDLDGNIDALVKAQRFLDAVEGGAIEVTGYYDNGRLRTKKAR